MSNLPPESDDAAAWWALRLADDPDGGEALAQWLAEDPRRSGSLLRAQAALSFLDRARALDPAVFEDAQVAIASRRPSRREAVLVAGGAVAASVGALAVGTGWGRGDRLITGFGEIRRAELDDGSVATLNAGTVVNVALHPRARLLRLDRGEAWFKVSHDPDRPFVVASGSARVRAVGTAFAVRRDRESTEVMVTEGVVEVWIESGAEPSARQRLGGGAAIHLDPTSPKLAPVANPQDIARRLAWLRGEIELDGQTVREAAAEFNRYNRRKLVIDDAGLAGRPFVGLFHLDEPDAFAQAVAATTGSTVQFTPLAIRLGPIART